MNWKALQWDTSPLSASTRCIAESLRLESKQKYQHILTTLSRILVNYSVTDKKHWVIRSAGEHFQLHRPPSNKRTAFVLKWTQKVDLFICVQEETSDKLDTNLGVSLQSFLKTGSSGTQSKHETQMSVPINIPIKSFSSIFMHIHFWLKDLQNDSSWTHAREQNFSFCKNVY